MKIILQIVSNKLKVLFVITVLTNSMMAIGPSLVINLANQLGKSPRLDQLLQFSALAIGVYLVSYSGMLANNLVLNQILKTAFTKLTYKSIEHYIQGCIKKTQDEMIAFLSQDLRMYRDAYFTQVFVVLAFSGIALSGTCYLFLQNMLLGPLFVIGTALMVLPQVLLNGRLEQVGQQFSMVRNATLTRLMDGVRGASTLVSNQAEASYLQLLSDSIIATEQAEMQKNTSMNQVMFIQGMTRILGELGPFLLGVYLISDHLVELNLASLVAMLVASQAIKEPIQKILYGIVYMQQGKVFASQLEAVFVGQETTTKGQVAELSAEFDELVLDGVGKAYNQRVLYEGLHHQILNGQKIRLTGPSGSGKSTLLKGISGVEAFDSGSVYLLSKGKKQDLAPELVGVIHQSPFVFNGTLRDNLTLGQDFEDTILKKVLAQVQLLAELPEGLEFEVVNNGDNLSGGQIVRLEIARFLLRQKAILLADEMTANLDPKNADNIRQLLLDLPITLIEVSHHVQDEGLYDQVIHIGR